MSKRDFSALVVSIDYSLSVIAKTMLALLGEMSAEKDQANAAVDGYIARRDAIFATAAFAKEYKS